ncbi:MAG: phosphoribosylamine--glycine ligase [Nitrospirota bacterium]
MKILVIGGGGREAALVHKISKSPRVTRIFCAPGNAGIASHATRVPIADDQIDSLLKFAKENQIDLTIVGPEKPLSLGIVNRFREAGLRIFGPTKEAAQLESSKVFSKNFMRKYKIPTANAEVATLDAAYEKITTMKMPIVLKVDGLAAGKGVVIANNPNEAKAGLDYFRKIGKGTEDILIEQYLTGVEATFFVVADGEVVIPLATAKDHKRLMDADHGPNTGGMGAISPAPFFTPDLHEQVMTRIVRPTLKGLSDEGISYQGVLYVGLMLTNDGPYVLEFNARLGDPEAQVVLPRLLTDWIDLVDAVISHRLDQLTLTWEEQVAVCVVLASKGYPDAPQNGDEIFGLDQIKDSAVTIFHSGTKQEGNKIVTSGGRVLGITALGSDLSEAREKAYQAVGSIQFSGMQYRNDIGK